MMDHNELKKNFYKYNNVAEFKYAKKGILYYAVVFAVPMDDMGDAQFERDIPAKLLIRYII